MRCLPEPVDLLAELSNSGKPPSTELQIGGIDADENGAAVLNEHNFVVTRLVCDVRDGYYFAARSPRGPRPEPSP